MFVGNHCGEKTARHLPEAGERSPVGYGLLCLNFRPVERLSCQRYQCF